MRQLTPDEWHVLTYVCPQSISGLVMSGLFYGWGSLVEAIDEVYSPLDSTEFRNQHGLFCGVIILTLSVMPMPLLRLLLDSKRITEFQIQFYGMIMCTIGLFFGGIALQFKNLYILYFLCAVPCGIGGLGIYHGVNLGESG